MEGLTSMLIGPMNSLFSPILALNPMIALFLLSSIITISIIVLTKKFTDVETMKELREGIQNIREDLTDAQKKGDKDNTDKLLNQMMEMNAEFMKHSYKSLLISLIVISIFLPWLKYQYSGMVVANLPFEAPIIGKRLNWIGWYVLVSFTMGWVIRKILGMQ